MVIMVDNLPSALPVIQSVQRAPIVADVPNRLAPLPDERIHRAFVDKINTEPDVYMKVVVAVEPTQELFTVSGRMCATYKPGDVGVLDEARVNIFTFGFEPYLPPALQ
jgi:hypothetical protein